MLEKHRDCLSKHAYMHFVLADIINLCVCVLLCVCVDEDIRVSRAGQDRNVEEDWGKEDAVCLKCTHTSPNIPSLLSVMASALTVCVARSFEATTTRHNTVYLGNSLPLHHSLLLCTSLFRSLRHISAPLLSSLTMTLRKP